MTKAPLSSKTIIFNIISILAIGINEFMEIFPTTPQTLEVLSMVMIGINLVLRFLASAPLSPGFAQVATSRSAATPIPKPFFVSATVWMNVLSLIVVVIDQSRQGGLLPEAWTPYLVLVVAVLNAFARFFVDRPIMPSLK